MREMIAALNEPFVFSSAGRFVSENHSVHSHRRLESAVLLLGYEGCCPIAQENCEYVLEKGDALLLFPGYEHFGTAPVSVGQSHFWCHFLLPEGWTIRESGAQTESEIVLPEYIRVEHPERYFILFHQLIDAANKSYVSPLLRKRVCDAYVNVLLGNLADEYLQHRTATIERNANRQATVARVKEWIRLHLMQDISTRDVAAAFPFSGDYLTRLFRMETGETICGYIMRLRMEEAKKLLLNTDLLIAQIAYAVGFHDEKYFLKAFRRREGVTPSDYREAHFHIHINNR